MGALWAVLGGVIAIVIGVIGIIFFFSKFLTILAGTIPIMLICGGLIALFIGFSEIKDSLKKDEDTTFSDYKVPEVPEVPKKEEKVEKVEKPDRVEEEKETKEEAKKEKKK
ncbi:MAG: hypothetical protein ACMUIP_17895 [bacterium]